MIMSKGHIRKISILTLGVVFLIFGNIFAQEGATDVNQKGMEYLQKGDYDGAITEFTKVIEQNPQNAEAYNNRGSAYARQGKNDQQAVVDYSKSIELNPNFVGVYYNRGLAYAHQDNNDQAIPDYSKVIELSPKYADVYYSRALAYYAMKNYAKASEDANKAQELGYNVPQEFFDELKKASEK